jgi:hypothetical protein
VSTWRAWSFGIISIVPEWIFGFFPPEPYGVHISGHQNNLFRPSKGKRDSLKKTL